MSNKTVTIILFAKLFLISLHFLFLPQPNHLYSTPLYVWPSVVVSGLILAIKCNPAKMMSLVERINLLNRSNSDSSNKENIEDYAPNNRSVDIFDGSLELNGRRNSSIRKLKDQFEQQQPELEERVNPTRISLCRQYSREKKLVKTKIEAITEQQEKNKAQPVVVVTEPVPAKVVDSKPASPTKHLRFFVGGATQEAAKDKDKENQRVERCNRVQSTTACDFESIYKSTKEASSDYKDKSVERDFQRIYSRLSAGDRSKVDERFEAILKFISQDNLGMIFDFHFPLVDKLPSSLHCPSILS